MRSIPYYNHTKEREPALDALRVFLLLFNFIFHSALSYTNVILTELWPYHDKNHVIFWDGIVTIIHVFTMPAFFFISGYVVEKSYQNNTPLIGLKKRLLRIGIPLILGIFFCVPIINLGFNVCNGSKINYSLHSLFPCANTDGLRIHTAHLWFLYYLLFFSVIHAFLSRINKRISYRFPKAYLAAILCISMAMLFILLYFDGQNDLHGNYSLVPDVDSLSGFFIFYYCGITFQRNKQLVTAIIKWSKPMNAFGCFFTAIYLYALYLLARDYPLNQGSNLIILFLYCLVTIILTFAILGLFLRFYKFDFHWVKYLSRSSYFLYIIHVPVIIWVVALLSKYDLSPLVKCSFVLFTSIAICLLINVLRVFLYHTFNRAR